MTNEVADILLHSPRISGKTLGYLAATLDAPQETEGEVPHLTAETTLFICNCPSYAYAHRH